MSGMTEPTDYVTVARQALVGELEAIGSRVTQRADLLDLYTLLLLSKGPSVTGKDVHDAWAVRQVRIRPDHYSIIPYEQLDPEKHAKDDKYVQAIIRSHEKIHGVEGKK